MYGKEKQNVPVHKAGMYLAAANLGFGNYVKKGDFFFPEMNK